MLYFWTWVSCINSIDLGFVHVPKCFVLDFFFSLHNLFSWNDFTFFCLLVWIFIFESFSSDFPHPGLFVHDNTPDWPSCLHHWLSQLSATLGIALCGLFLQEFQVSVYLSFLLWNRPMHACSVTQSCPTLCNHMVCDPPGSAFCGILQGRILEWVAISYSKGSS